MELTIRYFGKIAEYTSIPQEKLMVPPGQKLGDLVSNLTSRYGIPPEINFKTAVDQRFVELDYKINQNLEVALLPPFSGG